MKEISEADFELRIPDTAASSLPVDIDAAEFVPDAYEAILQAEKDGLITITRYEDMSEKMKEWNEKAIREEYENAADHPEYRHFLKGNFPKIITDERRMTAQELFELAMKHIYGDGVKEDNDLAFELLSRAHELGHVEAAYNLGICYHYGYGTNADLKKAFELYLEAAEKGYGKGMELVGRFYNRGIYVNRDRAQAEHWLEKAEESSDPAAAEEAEKELAVKER